MSQLQSLPLPKGLDASLGNTDRVDPFTLLDGRFHIRSTEGRVLGVQVGEDRAPVTTYTNILDTSDSVLWTIVMDGCSRDAFTIQNVAHKLYLAVRETSIGSSVIVTTRAQAFEQTHIDFERIALCGHKLVLQFAEEGDRNQQVTVEAPKNTTAVGWWKQRLFFSLPRSA